MNVIKIKAEENTVHSVAENLAVSLDYNGQEVWYEFQRPLLDEYGFLRMKRIVSFEFQSILPLVN